MSGDSRQEELLKMYNISCRYNGPFRHWKVVPGYVYDIVYAHTNWAASQEQLAERPNNNPIVDGRTELEHYLDNHEIKGFYDCWDGTGLALRILLAPSLEEPPTTISVMHGNWLGITEPVDEDPTSSDKEEDEPYRCDRCNSKRSKKKMTFVPSTGSTFCKGCVPCDLCRNKRSANNTVSIDSNGNACCQECIIYIKAKEQDIEQARLAKIRKDDTEVVAYWKARRDKEEADIMANFNERAMAIVVAALGLRPGTPVAHAHADAPVAHADVLTEADADQCCWICGNADHLSYVCPDNCCWICGDRDHWSNRCRFNMAPYEKVLEALTDLWWFEDLCGEDLMSMYHAADLHDIAAERLRLLRRKAEE